MPLDYATLEDAREYGYQSTEADDPILGKAITRASRIFDKVVGVADGYFAAGDSGQSESARRFDGDGTNYLQVDPYLSAATPTVALSLGLDSPTFLQSNPYQSGRYAQTGGEFFLIRTYGDEETRFEGLRTLGSELGAVLNLDMLGNTGMYVGWPDGIKVTVTAKWGWDAIPSEVTEAVLEIAIAIWRGRDAAFARVVNLGDSQTINGALPDRAKLIADKYRMGRMTFA